MDTDVIFETARIILAEMNSEVDYLQSSMPDSSARNIVKSRTFTGSTVDKAVFSELMTAVMDDNSEFTTSPRLGCLKLSLIICLDQDKNRARRFAESSKVSDITEDQYNRLYELLTSLVNSDYTDAQVFSSAKTDDAQLETIRRNLVLCIRTIEILGVINDKIQRLHTIAMSQASDLRHRVNEQEAQKDLSINPLVEKINDKIELLQQAIDSDKIVFMRRLTYPERCAKYVCGHCGEERDARGMLYSRIRVESSDSYKNASDYILNNSNVTQTEQGIARDACLFSPERCSCGYVNIPEEGFLKFFKFCVISRWRKTPPKKFSDQSIISYGAGIVADFLDSSQGSDVQYLPVVEYEDEKAAIPKCAYTDIYSSETYSQYLSGLEMKASYKLLENPSSRNICFLKNLISRLQSYSIGSSPTDVVSSVIQSFMPSDFTTTIDSYYSKRIELAELKIILAVISNKDFTKPFTEYSDIYLSADYIRYLLQRHINLVEIKSILEGQYSESVNAALSAYVTELENDCLRATESIRDLCHAAAEKFVMQDMQAKNTSTVSNTAILADELFTLKTATADMSKVVNSGVAALIWEEFEPYYELMLINTVVANRRMIYATSAFRGVFKMTSESKIKQILKDIYCITQRKAKLPQGTIGSSIEDRFILALNSCLSAVDSTALIMGLNISRGSLLRGESADLPSWDDTERIINYRALDSTYYTHLSAFAEGASLADFENILLADEDSMNATDESESRNVSIEAEIAACLYLICTPYQESSAQLRSEVNAVVENARKNRGSALYSS